MAKQTVFSRAVGYHLSSAIPVQLDRVDEFAVGKVNLATPETQLMRALSAIQGFTCSTELSTKKATTEN